MSAFSPYRRSFLRQAVLAAGGGLWLTGARSATASGSNPGLRYELEKVYLQWLQAMNQKDIGRWAAATSRYRQMCLRNQVVSLKQPWPRAVFNLMLQAPNVTRLQFLDASELGDTARLVYFGRVDFHIVPGEITPENPLILNFLKEDGAWKFNGLQYVNLNHDEGLKREVRAGGKLWLMEEDFQLTGEYPEIPKPCPEPYQVATVSVTALGCSATVEINGIHRERVDNTSADHVVIGGLRKGANAVRVTPSLRSGQSAERAKLSVIVNARTNVPGRTYMKLLHWTPPSIPWEKSYDLRVMVRSVAELR